SFGDQRERLAVDGESEAEHAPGLRLQLGVAEIPSLDGGSSEQLLDQSAEFGHAWLPTTIQELVEALNHGLHLAIAGSSPPGTTTVRGVSGRRRWRGTFRGWRRTASTSCASTPRRLVGSWMRRGSTGSGS